MNNNVENLHIKVGLSGTFWDKPPKYSILFNGRVIYDHVVMPEQNTVVYKEFDVEAEEDKEHLLEIRLENKLYSDTVENADKTAILKDMLLNIQSIEIDDIDIGTLKWTASKFVGDDPKKPVLENCINLGWNGSYQLKFSSPFYLWLLENL